MFAYTKKEISMKALLPTFLTLCLMISAAVLPAQVRNYTTQQENLPCLNKTFSVVLHIVRDTFGDTNVNPADFSDRLAELNTSFEPICAKFQVCETRFIDNFQYDDLETLDEWNELLVKEHLPNRINVFLVSTSTLDLPQECGYATMNGIAELETGGIVMVKGGCLNSGSKAIQHLFGHYFGLLHSFEGNGTELVSGANCDTEGDLICDTPADPYNPIASGIEWLDNMNPCRFIYDGVDANDEFYRPDVGNYMSYYEDNCRCGFTHDQYAKMAENFFNSSPKMW
jgi:hypothetical protein